jgi:iron complex outermembrane receptor protein
MSPAFPRFYRLGRARVLLVLLAGPPGAGAAGLPEMVVTGEWRDEELRDVARSVAVLDADTLRASTLQHVEEAIALVPNFGYSGDGNRARYLQVRGTGELEQYEGAPNPSVGFLVDDIDFSDIGGVATLFDVDRVEVLRGPQGTRYGANALAGLVVVRTVEPSAQPEARVEATVGSDDTWALGGVAGGAIPGTESLTGRIAVQEYRSDGFRHNAWLGRHDTNGRDELTTRAKLRWQPGADWRVDVTALYVDLDDGYDEWAVDNNGFRTYTDKPGRDTQRSAAGAVRASGPATAAATLTSITTFASSHMRFGFDSDWGNPSTWAPYVYGFTEDNTRQRRTVSQELRLLSTPAGRLPGGADWVLGAWAQRLSEANERLDQGVYDDGAGDTLSQDQALYSRYTADSVAIFGQLDQPIGTRLHLGVGLRGELRHARYDDVLLDNVPGDTAAPPNAFAPTDHLWGDEASLRADVTDRTSGWVRIARGYKAGGFNPSVAALQLPGSPLAIRFGPEFLWNFETGLHARSAGGAVAGDVALFWQQRHDMQVKVPFQQPDAGPNTFIFLTDNAERGHVAGLEGTLSWQAAGPLRLFASLGLLATRVERFTANPSFEGSSQPHAPPWSLAAGAEYRDARGWFARLDLTGRGSFRFDYDTSQGVDQKSGAAEVVGLRAGRTWTHWELAAWARNLLDERYAVRGFWFGQEPPDFPNRRYVRYGDPRHVGITLSYRY